MSSFGIPMRYLTVTAAACAVTLAAAAPSAIAAPTTDDQGFVDSTARCTAPSVAVVFGNTETSRVAICKTASGGFEYRGVRVRDGARLVIPASQSGDGGFVAEGEGVDYTVTSGSLVVSAGDRVIREEPMLFFRGPTTPAPSTTTPTTTTPTTPTTPLPPPLPAEVGGG